LQEHIGSGGNAGNSRRGIPVWLDQDGVAAWINMGVVAANSPTG
jgi:hypothetical protein